MKASIWLRVLVGVATIPTTTGQGTTVSIGLTYCSSLGAETSSLPSVGFRAPYYLYVAELGNAPVQYLDADGRIASISQAAQFVITQESQLMTGHDFISTDAAKSHPLAAKSPVGNISTVFQESNGFLRWVNDAFPSRKALFCLSNLFVVASFDGVFPDACHPVSIGLLPVSSLFNHSHPIAASLTTNGTGSFTTQSSPVGTATTRLSSLLPMPLSTVVLSSGLAIHSLNLSGTIIFPNETSPKSTTAINTSSSATRPPTATSMSTTKSVSSNLTPPPTTSRSYISTNPSHTNFSTGTEASPSSTIGLTYTPSTGTTRSIVSDIPPHTASFTTTATTLTPVSAASSDDTSTTTSNPATASCSSAPLTASLCPQRNGTTLDFSNDGICYGVLCSTSFVGIILNDNSTSTGSLRACTSYCILYNDAFPYGCFGVSYLGQDVPNGQNNCLLYKQITAEMGNVPGVDSTRLLYAGYRDVQERDS